MVGEVIRVEVARDGGTFLVGMKTMPISISVYDSSGAMLRTLTNTGAAGGDFLPQPVPSPPMPWSTALSPDGRYLAYVHAPPLPPDPEQAQPSLATFHLAPLRGGTEVSASARMGDKSMVQWLPDSSGVVFLGYVDAQHQSLQLLRIDGSSVMLADGSFYDFGVSPDARWVWAARSLIGSGTTVLLISSAVGSPMTLGSGNVTQPVFTPDSTLIGYVDCGSGAPVVVVAPVAGGPPKRFAVNGATTRPLFFTRDGRYLVCGSGDSGILQAVPASGGPVISVEGVEPTFSSRTFFPFDESGVVYTAPPSSVVSLRLPDPATTTLVSGHIVSSWSAPDGAHLFLTVEEPGAESLVLVDAIAGTSRVVDSTPVGPGLEGGFELIDFSPDESQFIYRAGVASVSDSESLGILRVATVADGSHADVAADVSDARWVGNGRVVVVQGSDVKAQRVILRAVP